MTVQLGCGIMGPSVNSTICISQRKVSQLLLNGSPSPKRIMEEWLLLGFQTESLDFYF